MVMKDTTPSTQPFSYFQTQTCQQTTRDSKDPEKHTLSKGQRFKAADLKNILENH